MNNIAIKNLAEEAEREIRKKHQSVKKVNRPILVDDISKAG